MSALKVTGRFHFNLSFDFSLYHKIQMKIVNYVEYLSIAYSNSIVCSPSPHHQLQMITMLTAD